MCVLENSHQDILNIFFRFTPVQRSTDLIRNETMLQIDYVYVILYRFLHWRAQPYLRNCEVYF